MKTLTLLIHAQIRGGKNHMNIDCRTGRHYPNRKWAAWRDGVVMALKVQRRGICFDAPCTIAVDYWPGDKIRRDVPGMEDALWHCLERAGIVEDDCLFVNCHWNHISIDRQNPRAQITITELP
jgi:Holliday junction resolvase RusA-like endonuclease